MTETPNPTCPPPPSAHWPRPKSAARRPRRPNLPTELGGRDGPEPVRYGDWEKKGIAIDF